MDFTRFNPERPASDSGNSNAPSVQSNLALPLGPIVDPNASTEFNDPGHEYRLNLESFINHLSNRLDEYANELQSTRDQLQITQGQQQQNRHYTSVLEQETQALRNETQTLRNEARTLKNQLNARFTATGNNNNSGPVKSLKINNPQEFHGERKKTKAFLRQIETAFLARPEDFFNDQRKINYLISFLRGIALEHIGNLRDKGELPTNYADFEKLLIQAFGQTNEKVEAVLKLRTIKQLPNQPCTKYANLFNNYALKSDYNDECLIDLFKSGLNNGIRDLLLTMPKPKTLAELQEQAILCDDRLFEDKSERNRGRENNPTESEKAKNHLPTVNPPRNTRSNSLPPNTKSNSGPQPMQIGALETQSGSGSSDPTKGMSKTQRQKYRDEHNLCRYCGKTDCGGVGNTKNCQTLKSRDQRRTQNKQPGNESSR